MVWTKNYIKSIIYIILKGTVIIVAEPGNVIMIPEGSVLENKVITGNLRILEH